jgi:platelet-activating factor acetylhydrolase IB subunit alpha
MPERFHMKGHKDQISQIAFHPLYDILATASKDSSIKIWESESGEIEKTLKGHTKKVNSIAFNRTGTMLASCGQDSMIKIWSMEKQQWIKTISGHEHNISRVKFLPSGDQIVTSSWDKTIKVWEVRTGFCVKTFNGHDGWIYDFDINEAGNRMISWTDKQEIIYWDLDLKGDRTIISILDEEHTNKIETVAFLPLLTAKTLTKSRRDQDSEEEQTGGNVEGEEDKNEEEKIDEKQTSSETKHRSSKADDLRKAREKIQMLKDRAAGRTDRNEEEKKEDSGLDDIIVKDDFIASGSRDKHIKIWNAKRGNWIMNLIGHDGWVRTIIFHPNGKYLLSSSDDKAVFIWDLSRNGVWVKKLRSIHTGDITSIALSKKSLATGSNDKTVKIFNLQ